MKWTQETLGIAQSIYQSAKDRGYSDAAALSIVGFVGHESGFDPNAKNKSSKAFGLSQWLGDRVKNLKSVYGDNPTAQQQIEYLLDEIDGKYEELGWNYKGKTGRYVYAPNVGSHGMDYYQPSRTEWMSAPTLEDAVFSINRGFGRPGTLEMADKNRINIADDFARILNLDTKQIARNPDLKSLKVKYMDGIKGAKDKAPAYNAEFNGVGDMPDQIQPVPFQPNVNLKNMNFEVDPKVYTELAAQNMNNQIQSLSNSKPMYNVSNAMYKTYPQTKKHDFGISAALAIAGMAISGYQSMAGAKSSKQQALQAEQQRQATLEMNNTANNAQALAASQQDLMNRSQSPYLTSFYRLGGRSPHALSLASTGGIRATGGYLNTVWTEQYQSPFTRAFGGVNDQFQVPSYPGVQSIPGTVSPTPSMQRPVQMPDIKLNKQQLQDYQAMGSPTFRYATPDDTPLLGANGKPMPVIYAMGGFGQLGADFGYEPLPGGAAIPTSQDTEYIEGANHEQGGVQYDDQNELEGGEVVYNMGEDDDYIFSDSMPFGEKTSFAAMANELAMQKGEMEEQYKLLQEALDMELKAVDGNENTAARGTHKRNAEKISQDSQQLAEGIAAIEAQLQELVRQQEEYGIRSGVYNEDGTPKEEYMRCGGRKKRAVGGGEKRGYTTIKNRNLINGSIYDFLKQYGYRSESADDLFGGLPSTRESFPKEAYVNGQSGSKDNKFKNDGSTHYQNWLSYRGLDPETTLNDKYKDTTYTVGDIFRKYNNQIYPGFKNKARIDIRDWNAMVDNDKALLNNMIKPKKELPKQYTKPTAQLPNFSGVSTRSVTIPQPAGRDLLLPRTGEGIDRPLAGRTVANSTPAPGMDIGNRNGDGTENLSEDNNRLQSYVQRNTANAKMPKKPSPKPDTQNSTANNAAKGAGSGINIPYAAIAGLATQGISAWGQDVMNQNAIRQAQAARPVQQVNPTAPRLNADVRYTADKVANDTAMREQQRWLDSNVGNPQVRRAMMQQAQANYLRQGDQIRQREYNDSRTIANQNQMLQYQNQVQSLNNNKSYMDQLSQFDLNMVGMQQGRNQALLNNANAIVGNINNQIDNNSTINMILAKYTKADGSLDPVGQAMVQRLRRSGTYWGRMGGKRMIGGRINM